MIITPLEERGRLLLSTLFYPSFYNLSYPFWMFNPIENTAFLLPFLCEDDIANVKEVDTATPIRDVHFSYRTIRDDPPPPLGFDENAILTEFILLLDDMIHVYGVEEDGRDDEEEDEDSVWWEMEEADGGEDDEAEHAKLEEHDRKGY